MSATLTERLRAFVARGAAEGLWPGGAFAVGTAGTDPAAAGAEGSLSLEPRVEPAREDALYDLASLTKGLVTAPLGLRLARRGLLDPDAPLDRVLPEWCGAGGHAPSFADLMLHRSGVPAWAPVYRLAERTDDVPAVVAARAGKPGGEPVYSCLGPIVAGIALERLASRPLRELFAEEIAAPLGLSGRDVRWSPLPADECSRAAPTERGRCFEVRLAEQHGEADALRGAGIAPGPGGVLRGEVHDGNAAFLGGAAGNAGLFATARAVFRIASAILARGDWLDEPSRARLATASGCAGDVRTLGFQSGASPNAPAGAFGLRSFGHVGFTGTSVWLDPGGGAVAVLLTNRVHPEWSEAPIQARRRAFHGLAVLPAGSAP